MSDLDAILGKLSDKLDRIGETTTETKTLMQTLIDPEGGRIPKLEEDVRNLDQFKWKTAGAGAAIWALVEFFLHGKQH